MDKCPKCGHYMLNYVPSQEAWVCWCQHVIYNNQNQEGCHCSYNIPESRESFNKRLLEQNHKGRYSVEPPTTNQLNRQDAIAAIQYELWEHELNQKEKESYKQFYITHKAKCYPSHQFCHMRVFKSKILTGNVKIVVQCPECTEKSDITDYESWSEKPPTCTGGEHQLTPDDVNWDTTEQTYTCQKTGCNAIKHLTKTQIEGMNC